MGLINMVGCKTGIGQRATGNGFRVSDNGLRASGNGLTYKFLICLWWDEILATL